MLCCLFSEDSLKLKHFHLLLHKVNQKTCHAVSTGSWYIWFLLRTVQLTGYVKWKVCVGWLPLLNHTLLSVKCLWSLFILLADDSLNLLKCPTGQIDQCFCSYLLNNVICNAKAFYEVLHIHFNSE